MKKKHPIYSIHRYISESNLWLFSLILKSWKFGFVGIILGLFASLLEGLIASLVFPLTTILNNNDFSQIDEGFPKLIFHCKTHAFDNQSDHTHFRSSYKKNLLLEVENRFDRS
jgi:hypothetical protein